MVIYYKWGGGRILQLSHLFIVGFVERWVVCYCSIFDIGGTYSHDDMLLSLQDGGTALMMASERGHMECVKALLDKGADVNIQNNVSAF